ncbi:Zinc finger, C2H2-like protein [Akanthomyces lecanii RCEF 1005]|uniref:Zinc finger, C2H2-like protein n=1 Tax=Akanthomyces lecanii RCEF 1005 TaxID=1081108 RepID=A0A162KRV9_CORDF|nr:Zinc finger, C2H2-like protein [Akanthomyces lecanii RCEF 1005]
MTGTTSNSGSSCGVCSITFDTVGAFRLHAKSPEHVANLRRKAAQSGAEIRNSTDSDSDSSISYLASSDSDSEPEPSGPSGTTPGFIAEQCLFCNVRSADFDASLIHMASTHSFVVPYQSSLVVDLPTLVWYLHLVIYTYHECVACGSRRRSATAAQQHMQSKGHCRFDMANPEIRDFYDVSALDTRLVSELVQPDDGTIRLASGKIISQRGAQNSGLASGGSGSSSRKRLERGGVEDARETALAVQGNAEQQVVLDGTDRKMATAARQMAQLSVRDQQALAHLAPHEQRRELTLRRKQADRVRRAEWRAQAALGRKGNKTLMKTYKPQGPERPLG